MIVYFDTSALVPLLVAESSSDACRRLWDDADDVITCRLSYVEAAAALAQAHRLGRLADHDHEKALRNLDELWSQMTVIELDVDLMRLAAELAARHELRGYDAVHCAAAELADGPDTVAASGDQALLAAWATMGITTFDANA